MAVCMVLGGLAGSPGSAAAQSLLASHGLGLLTEPLDARARALGGSGVGLPGRLLSTDPAASAALTLPSVTVTYQPSSATLTNGAAVGNARFPILGVTYPVDSNVFSLQLSSFLDQEWQSRTVSEVLLDTEFVTVTDLFTSSGGVGRAHLGWARTLPRGLSVGVTIGRYAGTSERTFVRSLDPEDVGTETGAFINQGRWAASGLIFGGGVAWESPLFRIAGSASLSQDLTLTAAGGVGSGQAYAMPIELRAGGAFTVAPNVVVSVGGSFADWSETGEDLAAGESRAGTWSYGGGVELTGAEILGRELPVRVGARQVELPFANDGSPATERMIAGGFGLHLVETNEIPTALLDFAFERGQRRAGALDESFLRTTITLRITGN